MDNSVGNSQEVSVPPVEGVAGGGTSYGWTDASMYVSSAMKGSIDPSEVPSSELVHVWCVPSTVNVGSQEMPRHLEQHNALA
ncbi:Glutamyl-tRNA(Gln) amidotransferase subunit B mitochondrial [Bienertia sinuspersici]